LSTASKTDLIEHLGILGHHIDRLTPFPILVAALKSHYSESIVCFRHQVSYDALMSSS